MKINCPAGVRTFRKQTSPSRTKNADAMPFKRVAFAISPAYSVRMNQTSASSPAMQISASQNPMIHTSVIKLSTPILNRRYVKSQSFWLYQNAFSTLHIKHTAGLIEAKREAPGSYLSRCFFYAKNRNI